MLSKSFIKIKSLSEDFFCTGDIQTLNYFVKVYIQFLNNEPLDFFISGHWDIELACQNMKRELDKFIDESGKIFQILFSFIPKKSKFKKKSKSGKIIIQTRLDITIHKIYFSTW